MARPSKYKPAYCDLLIKHMSEGGDFRSFAGKVDTTEKTIYDWRKKFPEFEDAFLHAIEKAYAWWEEMSRKYLFIKKDEERIDTGMFVLNMRNRFHWLGKDKAPALLDDPITEDEIYAKWEKNRSER